MNFQSYSQKKVVIDKLESEINSLESIQNKSFRVWLDFYSLTSCLQTLVISNQDYDIKIKKFLLELEKVKLKHEFHLKNMEVF